MQSEAHAIFGFSPKRTQVAAQNLYVGGYTSYPRTSSQKLPESLGFKEIFAGLEMDATEILSKTFTADNNEMVIEKDIVFYSTCEHHFMPFYGKAHVAYIPNGKVVGLSKLARTVEVYAKRPQIQEQLTSQIADALMEQLGAKGVIVMMEAEHMCMTMRGVKKPGSKTVTFAMRGAFEEDEKLANRFFMMCK